MDAQIVEKPRIEQVGSPSSMPKGFEDFKQMLEASKELMPKFEENVGLAAELRIKIPAIEEQVNILKKQLKEHSLQLKKSLQTLETNVRPLIEEIVEEKITELKKEVLSLKKMVAAYSQLPDLTGQLTERFAQHETEINDLQKELNATKTSNAEKLTNAIEKTTKTINNLDTKFTTVINSQNARNIAISEQLQTLQTQFTQLQKELVDSKKTTANSINTQPQELSEDQYNLIITKVLKQLPEPAQNTDPNLHAQITALQSQITFLKRIIGLSLTAFAGLYLWLQVQSGEFDHYFSR